MSKHTISHALRPQAMGCRHTQKEIEQCVVCGKNLGEPYTDKREFLDTCGRRCRNALLKIQRMENME